LPIMPAVIPCVVSHVFPPFMRPPVHRPGWLLQMPTSFGPIGYIHTLNRCSSSLATLAHMFAAIVSMCTCTYACNVTYLMLRQVRSANQIERCGHVRSTTSSDNPQL
jgi:hypothetical protein